MNNPRVRKRPSWGEIPPLRTSFSRTLLLALMATVANQHHVHAFLYPSQSQKLIAECSDIKPFFAIHPQRPLSAKSAATKSSAAVPSTSPPAKPKKKRKKDNFGTFRIMYKRLKEYYHVHGHCLVSSDDEDVELYKWTRSIRKNYKHQFTQQVRPKQRRHQADSNPKHKTRRPLLSERKVKLFEEVEFCWDVQEAVWQQKYEQLSEFFQVYGNDPDVPVYAEDPALAIWLQNQRADYRLWLQDLPSNLTEDRLEALEALGVFEDYKTQGQAWAQYYQYLVEYHQKHGHANVPQKYQHPVTINVVGADGAVHRRETEFSLGRWCMNQRSARRRWQAFQDQAAGEKENAKNSKKKGKKNKIEADTRKIMNAERIRLLDALDFLWNFRDTRWHSFLRRLQEFYETNGHLKISTTDANNQDLRYWLNLQRHFYQRQNERGQRSPLTDARINALEQAFPDFSWQVKVTSGPSAEDWSSLFSAMRERGISPDARAKQHWFEGVNPFQMEVKSQWTEQELVDLFNQGEEDDDDDGGFMLGDDGGDVDFYEELDHAESLRRAPVRSSSWSS